MPPPLLPLSRRRWGPTACATWTPAARRVAVGGGACADLLRDALALGCDTFVTADVKYNGFLDAKALGVNLIDAGHYPTEQVVCPVLAKWLAAGFPQVEILSTSRHKEAFLYL